MGLSPALYTPHPWKMTPSQQKGMDACSVSTTCPVLGQAMGAHLTKSSPAPTEGLRLYPHFSDAHTEACRRQYLGKGCEYSQGVSGTE